MLLVHLARSHRQSPDSTGRPSGHQVMCCPWGGGRQDAVEIRLLTLDVKRPRGSLGGPFVCRGLSHNKARTAVKDRLGRPSGPRSMCCQL